MRLAKNVRGTVEASESFRGKLVRMMKEEVSSCKRYMYLSRRGGSVILYMVFIRIPNGLQGTGEHIENDDTSSSISPPPTPEWLIVDSIVKSWIFLMFAKTLQEVGGHRCFLQLSSRPATMEVSANEHIEDDDTSSSTSPPPTPEWLIVDSIVKSWIFLMFAETLQGQDTLLPQAFNTMTLQDPTNGK
nr:hypothetical protein [Tanacetum cinerariifolium]